MESLSMATTGKPDDSAAHDATNRRLSHAARHVATIFSASSLEADEFMELRTFRGKQPGPRTFHREHGDLISEALRLSAEGWDLFIGVAPRRCPDNATITSCPHRSRGGKDHIARIGWAFVEVDVGKGHDSVDAILERFDGLPLPPELVVTSGNGAHGYWQLSEPTADFGRVERLTRALSRQLGRDPAFDVSRVLRLAGTVNYKYVPPRPTAVVCWTPHAVPH